MQTLNSQEYKKYLKNRKSERTIKAYMQTVDRFLEFIKYEPRRLTQDEVSKFLSFLNNQGVGSRSLNRHTSTLRSYFKFKKKELYIDNFSFDRHLPRWLNITECKELEAAAETELELLMVRILRGTGIRVSEFVNIKVKDVDYETMEMSIFGKGAKERKVPIPQSILAGLNVYIHANNIQTKVFPFSIEFIERRIKAMSIRAGLGDNVTPHTLRHSYATQYLNKAKDDPKAQFRLQQILGHTSLATTSIYVHTATKELIETLPDIMED